MDGPSQRSVYAAFSSESLTIGAGVAIFHIASARVVLCYHTRDKYWFLPKGRKNANEDVRDAAAREGFEESGYRNRLLPIPFAHRQTQPDQGPEKYVTEAIWIELLPLKPLVQYMLFWYIAETLPPDLDHAFDPKEVYRYPPAFPKHLTLVQRIAIEKQTKQPYEPIRHASTGVNEEEQCYESFLLPIDEAIRKLENTVMADVVRKGWKSIQQRLDEESCTR